MSTTNSFDRYVIRIDGSNTGRTGWLFCYNGNSFVGRIEFYPDGDTLPQDYLWHPSPVGQYVVLHMPMSHFELVISTVRVEKPLHLHINVNRGSGPATHGQGYLATTDKEPVGEEEGTL